MNSGLKIGNLVSLKNRPNFEGIVKNIVEKKVDFGVSNVVYLYEVFWFKGQGSLKLYSASDLVLSVNQPKSKGI